MGKSFIDIQPGDILREVKIDLFPSVTFVYWRLGDEIHKRCQLDTSVSQEDFKRCIDAMHFYKYIGQKIREIRINAPYVVYVFENGAKLQFPLSIKEQDEND